MLSRPPDRSSGIPGSRACGRPGRAARSRGRCRQRGTLPAANSTSSAVGLEARARRRAGPSRWRGRRRSRWRCPPSSSSARPRSACRPAPCRCRPRRAAPHRGSTPSRCASKRHEGREMALPHRLGAGVQRHLAVVGSNRRSTVSSRMPPATSRKQPMPMPRSFPARSEAARRCRKALPVRQRQRLVQDRPRTRRCRRSGRSASCRASRRPGSGCAGAAPRDRCSMAPRRLVDQPLDQIDRLRPAGPAIGPERRRIGEHHLHADVDGRDEVDAGQAVLGVGGREDRREASTLGADADPGAHAQGREIVRPRRARARPRAPRRGRGCR